MLFKWLAVCITEALRAPDLADSEQLLYTLLTSSSGSSA